MTSLPPASLPPVGCDPSLAGGTCPALRGWAFHSNPSQLTRRRCSVGRSSGRKPGGRLPFPNERVYHVRALGQPMCTPPRTRWAAPFQFSNDAGNDTANALPSVNVFFNINEFTHAFKPTHGGFCDQGSCISEERKSVCGR